MFLPKKVSWMLLTGFVTFDSVVSYIAISRMGAKEADLLIAPFVEKYPLLYFPCIPLELIIIYLIVLTLRTITLAVTRHWKHFDKDVIEHIILTATVIFWSIANSLLNLLFILGYRLHGNIWGRLSLIGFIVAFSYGLLSLYLVSRNK
ncbi:MAG TPA: hypothetical protein VMR81_08370 [Patescibacteria group bacterium]|nr:hypothetical protein [Patescibacteria group bacterium]